MEIANLFDGGSGCADRATHLLQGEEMEEMMIIFAIDKTIITPGSGEKKE